MAWDEIESLKPIDLWHHGSLEMIHGGNYPDKTSFCGRCWQKFKSFDGLPVGERVVDFDLFLEDFEETITNLNHYGSDKKHPDYIFLMEKIALAKSRGNATLNVGVDYTPLEIMILSFKVNGNRLEIPQHTYFANYTELKKVFKNFGGKYVKNGFVFEQSPESVLKRIRNKETMNLKKEFQFFGTSADLCNELCEMTFDPMLNRSVKLLEPSAGQGAIIDAMKRWFDTKVSLLNLESITAIEFMEENHAHLEKKYDDIELIHLDFLMYDEYINYYDYVIGNPPFSKGQDMEHFRKMYDVTRPGGTVTSIMSTSWLQNTNKKATAFRKWLGIDDAITWKDKTMLKEAAKGSADYKGIRKVGNHDEEVLIKTFAAGRFKEAGTNVITCAVQVKKKVPSGFEMKSKEPQLQLF